MLLAASVMVWCGGASATPSCQGTYAATSLQPLPERMVVDLPLPFPMLVMAAGYERLAAHAVCLEQSGLPHEGARADFQLRGVRGTPRSW